MNYLQNAKVVDNEFVPVYETDKGNKVVIARELHESLFVSTRFNDWIQRNLLTVGFVDGTDFYSFLSKTGGRPRSEEHTSELQSRGHLVCRLLLEKKKTLLIVLP